MAVKAKKSVKKSTKKAVNKKPSKKMKRTKKSENPKSMGSFILIGILCLAAFLFAAYVSFPMFLPQTYSSIWNTMNYKSISASSIQSTDAAQTPSSAIEGYINAINESNTDKAKMYLSESLLMTTDFELLKKSGTLNISYSKVSEDTNGDKSVLVYNTDQKEASIKLKFTVEKVTMNGYSMWLITDVDVLEIHQK